jgi:hypothetical protein
MNYCATETTGITSLKPFIWRFGSGNSRMTRIIKIDPIPPKVKMETSGIRGVQKDMSLRLLLIV